MEKFLELIEDGFSEYKFTYFDDSKRNGGFGAAVSWGHSPIGRRSTFIRRMQEELDVNKYAVKAFHTFRTRKGLVELEFNKHRISPVLRHNGEIVAGGFVKVNEEPILGVEETSEGTMLVEGTKSTYRLK
ncbi:hypothetical protein [Streptomyces sp. CoH17]|uniref:hypothetical protein n=1 Tax=Streptomyces sp. CoH17 TaxID=2992806 RepID=UPI00226DE8E4|nr:hypothetical protein [Streptomyces sp. CoH17]